MNVMKSFHACCIILFLVSSCEKFKELQVICPTPDTLSVLVQVGEEYIVTGTSLDPEYSGGGENVTISYYLSGATQGTGSSLDGMRFGYGETDVRWIISGEESEQSCNICVIVSLDYDFLDGSWDQRAELPDKRAALTSCVVNDRIYVFGGAPDGDSRSK